MEQPLHSFDVTLKEAERIQLHLRQQVVLDDILPDISAVRFVGGADVAFFNEPDIHPGSPGDPGQNPLFRMHHATRAIAGIVVIDLMTGETVETVCADAPVRMPYIPGYLSFREGPAVLRALGELSHYPEVMVYDGCGIAHPRGLGIAAHLAVLTGIPSIGCAKNLLCGSCAEPGLNKGNWTNIVYDSAIVGVCLRTRTAVKPVYVSPGSGFSIESARELALRLADRYRLPEPTRQAHRLVSERKRAWEVSKTL